MCSSKQVLVLPLPEITQSSIVKRADSMIRSFLVLTKADNSGSRPRPDLGQDAVATEYKGIFFHVAR